MIQKKILNYPKYVLETAKNRSFFPNQILYIDTVLN